MVQTARYVLAAGAAMLAWAVAAAGGAERPSIVPTRVEEGALLFEAGRHPLSAINNYTARWKKGSDLTPEATPVTKGGAAWVELAFRGRQGMACSTLFFDALPPPDPGMRYRGLAVVIDCDRDDYPHIGVNVAFADRSGLAHDLALERGRHEYLIETGFRREKHPPPWQSVAHVMLTLDAARHAPDTRYRLGRITLRQVKADAPSAGPETPVADLFAQPILWPQPKQVAAKPGAFAARRAWPLWLEEGASRRTRRTAEIFAQRYEGYTGRRPALRTGKAESGLVLRAGDPACRPQGYRLTVEEGRVVIAGGDEPGLYYGTVTFIQLLKHAAKRQAQGLPVSCVEIVDWPDTAHRLARLEHPHTFRNYPVRENRGIEYLIDWTDRFVAGQKFNTLYLDVSANVRYRRRPEFNGTEKIYSLDDLRRLGAFCRDHFIDLCPAWQVGGHANWWLTIGYHPELRTRGWASQGDVTHPEHDAIVRDCMLDVIEAMEPKYLSPKSDEWWHEPKEGETREESLHGRTPAQAFLEWHVRLNDWLRPRGITMMIFEDMLSPYHNGKRFDTYKVIDSFPRDVILTQWSGGNLEKEVRYFTERGFRVWPNATGLLNPNEETRRRVIGFGKGLYSFGNDKSHLLDEYSPLWSIGALLQVADQAWNFARQQPAEPARLLGAEQLAAIRPNPRAVGPGEPLNLDAALRDDFQAFLRAARPESYAAAERPADLGGGVREVGFVPTRLAGDRDARCAVLGKGAEPLTLPVKGRFASLVFLHTARVDDPHDKAVAGVRIRDWMYGWPCGNYVVHYADGSQVTLPLRLTNNLKRFDTASTTRAALDTRYTWPLDDAQGRPIHLFQWEWVNPKPDAEIVRVVAEHDRVLDVTLVLLAVSGRQTAKD